MVQCTIDVHRTSFGGPHLGRPARGGALMREQAHPGRVGGDGESAILAVGLRKRFGKTWALGGVDLDVAPGTVCGLLGPNGAGKTTMVRILTTLLRPDDGYARVAGFDVVREAEQVRYHIGLAGQQAALDELLTGRANLVTFATSVRTCTAP